MDSGQWATSSTNSNSTGGGGGMGPTHLKSEDIDDGEGTDAEGVWAADIEQSFHEALAIYPPCGRRKIILSDEGKMYGRNELIARYIKVRTGKTRTRKQVSSHIQVLARRRSKEIQSQIRDPSTKEKCLQQLSQLSSAQIVSAPSNEQKPSVGGPLSSSGGGNPTGNGVYLPRPSPTGDATGGDHTGGAYWPGNTSTAVTPWTQQQLPDVAIPAWAGRSIAGPKMRLVELAAFMEKRRSDSQQDHHQYSSGHPSMRHMFAHISPATYTYSDPRLEHVDVTQIWDKFPENHGLKELYERGPPNAFFLVKFWAGVNTTITPDAFYAVTIVLEGNEGVAVKLWTKVCSFGKQVVEKIEVERPKFENGTYVYRFESSPMCDYMKSFIAKLLQLPQKPMMNSVLENFTILQIVSNKDTEETLLCVAYVFEVSQTDRGTQHHIYRLTRH